MTRMHPRDWHSWELMLPLNEIPFAQCQDCGLKLMPEEALRNRAWQDRQWEKRRAVDTLDEAIKR